MSDLKDEQVKETVTTTDVEKAFDGSSDKTASVVEEQVQTDPNIVDWDGPDDLSNPKNWTTKRKVANLSIVIFLCLVSPLASSMFAPGVPDVMKEFHTDSDIIAGLVVSVYILGYAVGPLLISPASEIVGRKPVYMVCNVMFLIFTIACAVAGSMNQLIVFRFFAGAFGVCPVTLGGASIADLIVPEKRGIALSLFALGPLLGPVIGPIAGAYLAAAMGWRWTFWIIAMAVSGTEIVEGDYTNICQWGAGGVAHLIFTKETFATVLLERKTQALRKSTDNFDLRSRLDSGLSPKQAITRALVRPMKLLTRSPIVTLMSIYTAIIYGILYLLFTTYTFVYEGQYGFSSSTVGLSYISTGIGFFVGLAFIGGTADRIFKALKEKNNGVAKPEYRLPPLLIGAWFVPAGLFLYGWTAQYHIQWAVPMLGGLLFGVGMIASLLCLQNYLIDAFGMYAASALAANTLLRSIVGGLLPLAGLKMYNALGLGWGNSLIGFLALAMIPIPFVFYKYGEAIRNKYPVKL